VESGSTSTWTRTSASSAACPRRANQIDNKAAKQDYLLEVDNAIVIPTGKKVRFLVTENDVIHAWWLPQLAGEEGRHPGLINETWTRVDEPGNLPRPVAPSCAA